MADVLVKLLALLKHGILGDLVEAVWRWMLNALISWVESLLAARCEVARAA
jgi:hypothetical protein